MKKNVELVRLIHPTGGASDAALKKDILPMGDGILQKVLALRPVTWRWRNPLKDEPTVQYGFIAQEVEKLFPDLVSEAVAKRDGNVRKHLEVGDLIPYLVEALKEQQQQISNLEERIQKLKK